MKRMILTGILAIGAGATCLMAQHRGRAGAAPEGPASAQVAGRSGGVAGPAGGGQRSGQSDRGGREPDHQIRRYRFQSDRAPIWKPTPTSKRAIANMEIYAERALEADPKDFRRP